MNKKNIVLLIVIVVLASAAWLFMSQKDVPVVDTGKSVDDGTPVMINNLKYHKNMAAAQMPGLLYEVPFGNGKDEVGGFLQDLDRYTEGMPWTFRPVSNDKVWVLDSVNKRLKLFGKDNKVEKQIVLAEMGVNVMDFAVYNNETFAFFNNVSGEIFVTDKNGEIKNVLRGFVTATSMEFNAKGELLIALPVAKGKVCVDQVGQLRGIYSGNQTLSTIESTAGGLYCLQFADKKAELFIQKGYNATSTVKIAEFEYELTHTKDVWFSGGEVYGCDANGNVYLGLVVCDIDGIIYRERIYKCTPEGKKLGSVDIISSPVLSPAAPRKRVIAPNGRILTANYNEDLYMISYHEIK
ncbi:MAG: hypothetical protein PHF29_05140 [Candidatus Riflebacteria bacterium]|nr:hypothetical protein [Candidatus Riflebacteria bacterium]MDD3001121.1 hypothetical protein [Candidatus Riflebacteria bacterium]